MDEPNDEVWAEFWKDHTTDMKDPKYKFWFYIEVLKLKVNGLYTSHLVLTCLFVYIISAILNYLGLAHFFPLLIAGFGVSFWNGYMLGNALYSKHNNKEW